MADEVKKNIKDFPALPSDLVDSDLLHVNRGGVDYKTTSDQVLKATDIVDSETATDIDKVPALLTTTKLNRKATFNSKKAGIVWAFDSIWTIVRNGFELQVTIPKGRAIDINSGATLEFAAQSVMTIPAGGGIVATVPYYNTVTFHEYTDISQLVEGATTTEFVIAKNVGGVLRSAFATINDSMYEGQLNSRDLSWLFNTSTADSDPGSGYFRLNNSDPSLATYVYFSIEDHQTVDVSQTLLGLEPGSILQIIQTDSTPRYLSATIGTPVNATGYVKIPITINDSGLIFESAKECSTSIYVQQSITADEKVKVGSDGTPDFLNSSYFNQSTGQNIRPAISEDKIWVGDSNGIAQESYLSTILTNAISKTTPVDADEIPIVDSAASYVLKKQTIANLKATLKTYFDGFYRLISGGQGADVASAASLAPLATGTVFNVTGTTTINNIVTTNVWATGSKITLKFAGILTITHNGTVTGNNKAIYLKKGANYTTVANDILELVFDGTYWRETNGLTATSSGSGGHTMQLNSTSLSARTNFNVVTANSESTLTDDSANNQTDYTPTIRSMNDFSATGEVAGAVITRNSGNTGFDMTLVGLFDLELLSSVANISANGNTGLIVPAGYKFTLLAKNETANAITNLKVTDGTNDLVTAANVTASGFTVYTMDTTKMNLTNDLSIYAAAGTWNSGSVTLYFRFERII